MFLKVLPISASVPSSKATPTFLSIYYGSTPLSALNIWPSYLFLCNKLPQNLAAESNKHLLSYSLDESEILVWFNWIHCLKTCYEVVTKLLPGAIGSFEVAIKGQSAS